MIDFTSALYLGQHPLSVSFPPQLSVTTGKPAALCEPRLHQEVAQEVARKQGLERGLLAPSTLHVFWDIITLLGRSGAVLLDEATYPVGRWGVMRAVLRGVPVASFPANDAERLARLIHGYRQQHRIPWIVTDGWNVAQGKPAPLARYLELLKPCAESVLLVDDTQAFGILGQHPTARLPYGTGGGGCLPHLGLQSPKILTITSLAKGLGVPVAVLAGSTERIERYRRGSEVRVHTSPVSNLHAWAAWQALQNDRSQGDALRNQLYRKVGLFKRTLRPVATTGGWFPVQKLALPSAQAVFSLYHLLRRAGIQSLLLANDRQPTVPKLAFCIRADHPETALVYTARQIATIIGENKPIYAKSSNVIDHEPIADSKINPPSRPKSGHAGQSVY